MCAESEEWEWRTEETEETEEWRLKSTLSDNTPLRAADANEDTMPRQQCVTNEAHLISPRSSLIADRAPKIASTALI